MKAIETQYNGYKFRSRLEARWAVFFDTLGIRYEYEKEGYELTPNLWYLPDFWLPDYNYWVEIKPDKPSEQECMKAALLAKGTNFSTFILYGELVAPCIVDYDNAKSAQPFGDGFLAGSFPADFCYDGFYMNEHFKGLAWFLRSKGFKFVPEYDGKIETAYQLIELDKLYYQDKYHMEHPNWQYGLNFRTHFVWGEDFGGNFQLIYQPMPYMASQCRTPLLLAAYQAARSARFEVR